MNWKNLKQNKCPKCSKVFGVLSIQTSGMIICGNSLPQCNFIISEKRFREIVSSMITQEIEEQLDKEFENED